MGETFTALHPVCFCLRGFKGRDQTFTENKRDVELKTAVVESNQKKRGSEVFEVL